jgi:hypothetical protein
MDGPFCVHETVQAEAGTTIAYTLQDSAPRVLLRITANMHGDQARGAAQAAQRMTAQTRVIFEIITGNSFQDKQN